MYWGGVKSLRSYIKHYQIDILFSPSSAGLSNGLLASLGTKVKNVGYRGTQAKVRLGDPTYYLGVLNPRVAHIVCETDDIRDYLARFIPRRKLSVNLKPFEVEWVQDACAAPKQAEGIPEGAVACVYVGSCKGRPFKGLGTLVKAFHLLKDDRVHLVFVGDYDQADYELAQAGPSSGRIHFVGFREDAIRFLPGQDIFVLPSRRDASPRVVREAMACGLPCIVSDIPGARDLLIDGTTGLLFPPDSPQALADAIQTLANDRKRREAMGWAGRERILCDFKAEDYAMRFRDLFQSLSVRC